MKLPNLNRTGKIRMLFAIYYNGNLVTGDGKYREYDGFNHLVRIRDGNNATGIVLENLTWHPIEERIVIKDVYQTNGSFVETIYYPTKEFVRVVNATGSYDYNYIYQNGQLVAQEFIGEKKHFMLNDHKGTVQIVVNESGAKVEETFYSPFGEIISGGAISRFDYEGKEFDSVVGDYDYHARKVNPQWGMFTQPDTLLPNVYDPQQLNRYAFERNNPFKYVDEDGNVAILIPIIIGATIGAITGGLTEAIIQYSTHGEIKDMQRIKDATKTGALVGGILGPLSIIGPITSTLGKIIGLGLYASDISESAIHNVAIKSEEENNEEIQEMNPKKEDQKLNQDQPDLANRNPPSGITTVTGGSTINPRTISPESNRGPGGGNSVKYKTVTIKGGTTLKASSGMQEKLKKQGFIKR